MPRIALFMTCLADSLRPSVCLSTVQLLRSAGVEPEIPLDQICCGQPGFNGGDSESARKVARRNFEIFAPFDYVVIPSGSCGGMIKKHYPELFENHPTDLVKAQALADKTYELTQFLVDVLKVENLETSPAALNITYHDSCSGLRELGVKTQPRKLLSEAGVQVTEMQDCEQCCGFGGLFSVKYGPISSSISGQKCDNIQATGADAVVLGDVGCMLNIEGKLRQRGDLKTQVLHVSEVLTGNLPSKD